ncbi:MAG: hypothetical protein P8X73_03915 [Ignavibacteriaceae bacterium]
MIRKIWTKTKYFLPLILGAGVGFLYYTYIGCNGSCPISGDPYISTAYGSLIGALITDWKMIFQSLKKQN